MEILRRRYRDRYLALAFSTLTVLNLGAVACGAYGSDDPAPPPPSSDGGDANAQGDQNSVDSTAATDAAPRCDLSKPFDTPVPLTSLNAPDATDNAIRVSPDELTAYFSSLRGDLSSRIFMASRASREAAFEPPITLLSSPFTGALGFTTPSISADGLELYVEIRDSDAGPIDYRVGVTGRLTTAAEFPTPSTVFGIAPDGGSSNTGAPFISRNGLELYFTRLHFLNKGPGLEPEEQAKIYVAKRSGLATSFKPGVMVAELASDGHDVNPTLRADGLEIYFASTRDLDGDRKPYRARRNNVNDPWSNVELVPELVGGGAIDAVTAISDDGCVAYLMSNRSASTKNDFRALDLYVASRPRSSLK